MKRIKKLQIHFYLFLLILFIPSFSKENNNLEYHIKVPEFSTPPKIDGKLENPIWLEGAVLDSFTQYEPQEGISPSEKTVAYIGFDKKNLYVAVQCFDSSPNAIRASLTQRDKVYGDDEVVIYIDTFNDKKRAFVFQVNPCGVQSDGIYSESQRRHQGGGFERVDKNWDTFFLSDAHMNENGYTIEIAIPFKSLRFPNSRPQTWGFQIQRKIRRKNEVIYWYPRSRDVNGFLIQTGILEIDGVIEKGKNFEIMPVLTGRKEPQEKFNPEPSLNLKYGLTSNLTADITFNPDFSQIEADMPQIDVNQRYALRYPEKRPFFLEGKDFFDTPLELVYTRKIVDPQWGIKLSGKVGKTTIGFLSAYDENSTEIELHPDDSSEDDDDSSDDFSGRRAFINIFRLKQDLYPESHIGLIFTDKEMGNSLNGTQQDYNRVAGIDGHFKFKTYNRFTFQIIGSQTKFEDEKTSLTPAAKLNFSHSSRHISFSADYTRIPEEFESSTGFFRRKDIQSFDTRIGYTFLPQNQWVISVRPSLEYKRIYDFNNTLTDEEYELSCFISGWRQSHLGGGFSSEMERYNGINFHKNSFRMHLGSEPFSWLNANLSFSFGDGIYYDENPYLGYKTSWGLRLTLKPLTNFRLFYNFNNNEFSEIKGGERVYSINIISQRISYQISRTLSLRLITDYNDYDKKLYNSVLLSYELRPGTVFYLGVDDNQEKDDSGIFRGEGKYYFIKFSYWWRI